MAMSDVDRLPDGIDRVPSGMVYQWCTGDLITAENGWQPVPADRHGGEVGGILVDRHLTLCERSAKRGLQVKEIVPDPERDKWWDAMKGNFKPRPVAHLIGE